MVQESALSSNPALWRQNDQSRRMFCRRKLAWRASTPAQTARRISRRNRICTAVASLRSSRQNGGRASGRGVMTGQQRTAAPSEVASEATSCSASLATTWLPERTRGHRAALHRQLVARTVARNGSAGAWAEVPVVHFPVVADQAEDPQDGA